MPPKKKGKKGKKGKKSAGDDDRPKSGSDKGGPSSKELTELGREFFLIQVKDLEGRLARYIICIYVESSFMLEIDIRLILNFCF